MTLASLDADLAAYVHEAAAYRRLALAALALLAEAQRTIERKNEQLAEQRDEIARYGLRLMNGDGNGR